RDGVLGLPGALHGHGPRDDRLRHHAAVLRLQAAAGAVLPRVRGRAGPVRALLRAGPRHGPVAPLRAAPRPDRSDRALRRATGLAPRHQCDRVRDGGVPPPAPPPPPSLLPARQPNRAPPWLRLPPSPSRT